MNVFFTAAEYNPFHNGHAYHIAKARQAGATHVVAVMSPNFVQRGEPALFDKFLRARSAIYGGADLILELPLAFAVSSAERFASAAVDAALGSGCCDGFTFGCETPDLRVLSEIAELMNSPGFYDRIKKIRADGCSYPTACSLLCGTQYSEILNGRNNLLAIEYVRALKKRGFRGSILPVERKTAAHDSGCASDGFASAMFLRRMYRSGNDISAFVPDECAALYRESARLGAYTDGFERIVVSLLRAVEPSVLDTLQDADGGFSARLRRAVSETAELTELFDRAKTKRFTHASVRRAVYQAILSVTKEDAEKGVRYLRPLAFRADTAAALFKRISLNGDIPILSRHAQIAEFDEIAKKTYRLENRATDIFNSMLVVPRACGTDRSDGVFILGKTNSPIQRGKE
ncbi:MAG: nucleotidyltransferase family protein [Clostridia bacterium]|nr:nucleotidyltransferase family protein [Clostridia bacterium]